MSFKPLNLLINSSGLLHRVAPCLSSYLLTNRQSLFSTETKTQLEYSCLPYFTLDPQPWAWTLTARLYHGQPGFTLDSLDTGQPGLTLDSLDTFSKLHPGPSTLSQDLDSLSSPWTAWLHPGHWTAWLQPGPRTVWSFWTISMNTLYQLPEMKMFHTKTGQCYHRNHSKTWL